MLVPLGGASGSAGKLRRAEKMGFEIDTKHDRK